MDLESAIQHCEEVARQNEEDAILYSNCKKYKKNLYEIGLAENAEKKCCECANEHRQLAEWLKELKAYRDARAEINQALYDDARGKQNDYERGRKSGIFLCESIISVKLGEVENG